MTNEFEIRLEDAHAPSGEIRFGDLHAIADGLQELALRLARARADQAGPGRNRRSVEELSELRLRGLRHGSTVLLVSGGPTDQLDLELEDAASYETDFRELIGAISRDHRPTGVPDLVAESAARVATALRSAASAVEFRWGDGSTTRTETASISRETWLPPKERSHESAREITGVLEAVDLHSHTFAVRDDVGHRIPLRSVRDALDVGPLVGRRVVAVGEAVLDSAGRLLHIQGPLVTASPLSEEWDPGRAADFASELDKPGPDPNGGADFTDEEWLDFMAAVER